MNRRYVAIAPLVLSLLQFACTQAPPVPPDTRAADEKAIREAEAQWAKDFRAKDLDKIVSYYGDDASALMPGMPIITGKGAIRSALQVLVADPAFALDFSASKVYVSKGGDLAYVQGTYSMTSTDRKSKKPVTEKGKYLTVYKKQADGSWKAIEDMDNSDAAPIPVKTTASGRARKGHAKKSK